MSGFVDLVDEVDCRARVSRQARIDGREAARRTSLGEKYVQPHLGAQEEDDEYPEASSAVVRCPNAVQIQGEDDDAEQATKRVSVFLRSRRGSTYEVATCIKIIHLIHWRLRNEASDRGARLSTKAASETIDTRQQASTRPCAAGCPSNDVAMLQLLHRETRQRRRSGRRERRASGVQISMAATSVPYKGEIFSKSRLQAPRSRSTYGTALVLVDLRSRPRAQLTEDGLPFSRTTP